MLVLTDRHTALNFGRGAVVDELALIDALKQKSIVGRGRGGFKKEEKKKYSSHTTIS